MIDIRLQAARAELEAALCNGCDTSKHRAVIRQLEADQAASAQAEAAEREADRNSTEAAIHADAILLADESRARVCKMLETLEFPEFPL
ncbi:hypothetical protein [Burkholderia sp. Se-20378]|uniref:hypothetical protein n=1 Tax=Burkholderia sp. Se-20378 TaxID=2703899 RepID=UPI00197E9610|nr:hypothetical protein [Burkholderia sp. Se-20378]MBN3770714.1 hypothetical protein [Burkholderia sp. Se-20378]